jgi:hypothetical protein
MVDDGARVLLLVFFQLLLEVVDEDGKTACPVSEQSNNGIGLVAGWPKLAGGENKSGDTDNFESRRDLAMATRRRVSLFIAQRSATVIPTV